MFYRLFSLVILAWILLVGVAYAACPTSFTCQGIGGIISNTNNIVAAPSSSDVVPYVQGTTAYHIPGQTILNGPSVPNLTALRAACTAFGGSCGAGVAFFPSGVLLFTNSTVGTDSPPLFYLPGSSACGTDDGYSCVDSGDGKSWILQVSPPSIVVTSSGSINVSPIQTNFLWQPSSPVNTTATLPATPLIGEVHKFKNQSTASVWFRVAGNSGQTVDGNPYWVLGGPNDAVSVKWTGSGSSGNWVVEP